METTDHRNMWTARFVSSDSYVADRISSMAKTLTAIGRELDGASFCEPYIEARSTSRDTSLICVPRLALPQKPRCSRNQRPTLIPTCRLWSLSKVASQGEVLALFEGIARSLRPIEATCHVREPVQCSLVPLSSGGARAHADRHSTLGVPPCMALASHHDMMCCLSSIAMLCSWSSPEPYGPSRIHDDEGRGQGR